jgi:putative transposase
MRYSAAEKLEIIQLVGQSNLPQRRCLASLGIPRQTFYRWYDHYLTGGPEALACPSSNHLRLLCALPNGVSGPSVVKVKLRFGDASSGAAGWFCA